MPLPPCARFAALLRAPPRELLSLLFFATFCFDAFIFYGATLPLLHAFCRCHMAPLLEEIATPA